MSDIKKSLHNSSRHCQTWSFESGEEGIPKQSCSHLQKKSNSRRAAITVEMALAASLGVLVLFLMIGLFSNTIKDMIASSNMSRMYTNNSARTADTNKRWTVDPTGTQVNVQLVGEQGLQWYLTQAQTRINDYKKTPPQSESQKQDLAKQLTIARIGQIWDSGYTNLCHLYGISISLTSISGFMTTINGKSLYFNTQEAAPDAISSSPDIQLSIVKEVVNNSFK